MEFELLPGQQKNSKGEPIWIKGRWGRLYIAPPPPLEDALICFLERWPGGNEREGLPVSGYFKEVVKILWPKGSPGEVIIHPWFEDMLEAACEHRRVVIHGCASSGKSRFTAAWAVVNWLADPRNTMVLVTSTSLKDSRQRIWGDIVKLFHYSTIPLPGKLIDSSGIIKTDDGSGKLDDKNSISILPGAPDQAAESIGKIIGRKNKRVFLLADELTELAPSLVNGAQSNLEANTFFQMIGLGNFKSIYDPLGEMAEPVDGWKSITPDDTRWENKKGGVTVRLDGLKSPNLLAGEDKWPILGIKKIRNFKETLKGLQLWRMLRSFPSPSGDEALIITEADLISANASDKVIWEGVPTPVGALDPGFTNGGDRSVFFPGKWGRNIEGIWVLEYGTPEILEEDVENAEKTPRSTRS